MSESNETRMEFTPLFGKPLFIYIYYVPRCYNYYHTVYKLRTVIKVEFDGCYKIYIVLVFYNIIIRRPETKTTEDTTHCNVQK